MKDSLMRQWREYATYYIKIVVLCVSTAPFIWGFQSAPLILVTFSWWDFIVQMENKTLHLAAPQTPDIHHVADKSHYLSPKPLPFSGFPCLWVIPLPTLSQSPKFRYRSRLPALPNVSNWIIPKCVSAPPPIAITVPQPRALILTSLTSPGTLQVF